MKSIIHRFEIQTHCETELINITPDLFACVENSEVRNGFALVMSLHTTSAITVNEGLADLESDIQTMLENLTPDDGRYRHARFLHSDGQMAINAVSHLRSALLGFQAYFPIENGVVIKGGRQTVYFVELDGPQSRTYIVQLVGE
jgi:secondary thiamine-phosphate synthase enzyme